MADCRTSVTRAIEQILIELGAKYGENEWLGMSPELRRVKPISERHAAQTTVNDRRNVERDVCEGSRLNTAAAGLVARE
jgi:hypothetical protein